MAFSKIEWLERAGLDRRSKVLMRCCRLWDILSSVVGPVSQAGPEGSEPSEVETDLGLSDGAEGDVPVGGVVVFDFTVAEGDEAGLTALKYAKEIFHGQLNHMPV